MKVGDWSNVQDRLEVVNKSLDKSKVVLAPVGTPKFYIRMLVELEDLIQTVNKEAQKKMKPAVQHAFNRLRLSVPKHNRSSAYENDVKDCREHPEKYEEAAGSEDDESDDESDDDSDSEEDKPAAKVVAKPAAKVVVTKSKVVSAFCKFSK